MTAQEALDTIPYWQKRLRLMDWTITGKVTQRPLNKGTVAHAKLSAKYKSAEVTVLETHLIDPEDVINTDAEISVVHELLHLQCEQLNYFLGAPENEHLDNHMERMVELTADALVTLRRERDRAVEAVNAIQKQYLDALTEIKRLSGALD